MSQTINVTAFAGVPCYGKLFADGDGTKIGTDITGVEDGTRAGYFAFAVDGSLTGLHNLDVYRTSSDAFLGRLWAYLQGDGSSVDGEESAALANQTVSPGLYQPIFGVAAAEATATIVNCIVGETGVAKTIAVMDADGNAVPLAGYGDLRVIIETLKPRKVDVQVIENDDLTIGGTDGNELSFQPDATVLAKEAQYSYAVRQVSTGKVLIQGPLIVGYAPEVDS